MIRFKETFAGGDTVSPVGALRNTWGYSRQREELSIARAETNEILEIHNCST